VVEFAEDRLVDGIYAAALDARLWPTVLEAVSDRIGALQACLTRLSHVDSDGEGIVSRIDPAAVQAFYEYYRTRNVFTMVDDVSAWKRGWRPTVVTTADVMPVDDYYRTEYFNDFMRPQDAGATLHVRLELDESTSAAIAFGRSIRKSEFTPEAMETAQRLQPHLIRAYKMARLLATGPGVSTDLSRTLETTGQAVLIVDHDMALRHANPAAERLLRGGSGLTVLNGRVTAAESDGAKRLAQLVAQATAHSERSGGALSLLRPGHLPLALRVAPLAGEAMPIFARPRMALICATDLEAEIPAPEAELRSLFGLTPAEARLAAAVFEGLSLPEAADRFGISVNTTRFQLARVFDKTGAARQADLVKLMMRLAGGPAAHG
jgi:DNA-binding CsgD family transcriptional regulator/PAS domain-containing protein